MRKILYFITVSLLLGVWSCTNSDDDNSYLDSKIPCDSIIVEDRFIIENEQGIEIYVDSVTFVSYCKKYCEDNGLVSYW